jgi:hypothetical protein
MPANTTSKVLPFPGGRHEQSLASSFEVEKAKVSKNLRLNDQEIFILLDDNLVPDLLESVAIYNPMLPQRLDQGVKAGDKMSDPTREEINAKLATIEARTETRFVELSGKIDRMVDSIDNFSRTLGGQLADVKSELITVKSDNKFTRWTIAGVAVASALAGVGALWVTQGNLLAAFVAGLTAHH